MLVNAAAAGEGEPEKRYRIIDAHLHLFNTALNLPCHFEKHRTNATVEKALAAMDRGGVEKAFLISYTSLDIARGIRQLDPHKVLPLYSKEYQVAAWRRHPDRFSWITNHVDPSRKGYLDDLRARSGPRRQRRQISRPSTVFCRTTPASCPFPSFATNSASR